MAKKKKSVVPPIEVLIIGVFFLSFIAWAFKQCSDTKTELQEGTEEITAAVIPETSQQTATAPQSAVAPTMSNTTVGSNPNVDLRTCLLYTSPSPRDRTRSRMPSSA